MNQITYELADLVAVSALVALLAYYTGRAHAERANYRAQLKRRAHRHQQQQQKKEETK